MGAEPVVVALDSFYAAEDLTVEAPEWLNATVTDRFGDTKLTLEQVADGAAGTVTVTGNGVSCSVDVTGTTGIQTINVADAAEVYTLQGIRVNSAAIPASLYIVRRADGSTAKTYVK